VDTSYTNRSEVTSSGKYVLATDWSVGSLRTGTARDYHYDPIGNRTSTEAGAYTANSLNQYSAAPGLGAFSYDANGNLTSDGIRSYTYDAENRLVTVTQGSSSWSYVYDYLGRRIQKSGTGITTIRSIYDGWNLIAESDLSGSQVRRFVWGLDVSGSLQGAGGVGGLLEIDADLTSANTYFPLYDASHNVIGLYSSSGSLAAAYEYDPFGNLQTIAGSYGASNPFRSATKYTDTETGFVYYGKRYYMPALGRFINRDPIEEAGGVNLYGFCGNDGVNGWDLLGMDSDPFHPRGPFDSTVWVNPDSDDGLLVYNGSSLQKGDALYGAGTSTENGDPVLVVRGSDGKFHVRPGEWDFFKFYSPASPEDFQNRPAAIYGSSATTTTGNAPYYLARSAPNSLARDSDYKGGGSVLPTPTQDQINATLAKYGTYFGFKGTPDEIRKLQTLLTQADLFRRPNGKPALAMRTVDQALADYGDPSWKGNFVFAFGPGSELMPDGRTLSIERFNSVGVPISDAQMMVSVMHEMIHAVDKMREWSVFEWADRHAEIYRIQNQTLYDLGLPLDAGPNGSKIPDNDKYNALRW